MRVRKGRQEHHLHVAQIVVHNRPVGFHELDDFERSSILRQGKKYHARSQRASKACRDSKENHGMFQKNNNVPFRRRAARCSNRMTIEMASKAKTMVIELGMAQHEAAAKLGVNPGRVCEVVNGYKFPEAPFAPIQDVI